MNARGAAYLHGVDVLTGNTAVVPARPLPPVELVRGVGPALKPFKAHDVAETPHSEIPEVSDEAWFQFARAMKTQEPNDVSASNEMGMFAMKPRRLGDLGLMTNLTNTRSKTGRMVWSGEWTPPLTQQKFLSSPPLQYRAFAASMRRYIDGLRDGTVARPQGRRPDDMTLSGVLAILHRCGPSGLKTWMNEEDRFPDTVALYERANGVF